MEVTAYDEESAIELWRKMKEINFVDINYKKTKYDKWLPVESGLNADVRLIRLKAGNNPGD